MRYENSEMYKLIREAEEKSAVTCEMCGVSGKPREGGWRKTLCDWCVDERDRKRAKDAAKWARRKDDREES
jgi:hypothetical protein